MNERARPWIHAAVGLAFASACAGATVDDPPGPRVCDVDRCPAGACGVEVRLDPGCSDIRTVEVLLDGGLEPVALTGGAAWRSEGQIPAGVPIEALFQSDDRSWALDLTCPADGDGWVRLTLTCTGAGARVDTPETP